MAGNYAYVADGNNGLVIVDISNPASPTLKGSYDTAGFAEDVVVAGNYAYVADGNNGFVIIEISNPASPTLAGSYDTVGYAQDVDVAGNYAYVADGKNGFVILKTDIQNQTPAPIFPVANFTSNVTEGFAPLSMQFNASSGNATAWNWDFGDGFNSTEQNTTHTYSTAGEYIVNLTASNANGTDSKLAIIIALEQPIPPDFTNVPEFPSIALPVVAVLGMIAIIGRRKE